MNFNILIFILSITFPGLSLNEAKVNKDTNLLEVPRKKPPRPKRLPGTGTF